MRARVGDEIVSCWFLIIIPVIMVNGTGTGWVEAPQPAADRGDLFAIVGYQEAKIVSKISRCACEHHSVEIAGTQKSRRLETSPATAPGKCTQGRPITKLPDRWDPLQDQDHGITH
jgi:hypothetical protein